MAGFALVRRGRTMAVDAWARTLTLGLTAAALACGANDGSGRDGGSVYPTTAATADPGGSSGATSANSSGADEDESVACESDAECPDGEVCAAMSQVCLEPGQCQLGGDCDDGFNCEEGTCTIGGDCGGFQFELSSVPPNVMVLLDRSGSMSGDVDGTGDNRWEVAVNVIKDVTSAFNDVVNFGLATYSSCTPGGCSAGSVVTPLLPSNAGNIQLFLDQTVGAGSLDGQGVGLGGKLLYLCNSGAPETSTGVSLAALVGEPSLQDADRKNAVLLITDGGESSECTGSVNGPGGASMLYQQDPPVLTFAVGFIGASGGQLDQIATAGGTDQSYFALDPMELQSSLETILQAVASCSFTLDQIPPDEAEIYVFFDKDPGGVPNDSGDGWTYDEATNSVTFHGASCTAVKDGAVADIDIVYGCPYPPVG